MSSSNRSIRCFLFVCTIAAVLTLPSAALAQSAFHVTFGTSSDLHGRNADGATFVVQTDSKDIVVAGSGASFWSDTGRSHTNPLVARISSDGTLQWQRIYKDLENHRVTAFVSQGEEQNMLLEKSVHGKHLTSVTLRRIDRRGNTSEVIGSLEGYYVSKTISVIDGDQSYFLIVARKGGSAYEYNSDLQLFRLDLQGQVTELGFASGIDSVLRLKHLGGQEFLFTRWRQGLGANKMHTDFMRLGKTGETELLFTLSDRACNEVAASGNRIFCVLYIQGRRGLANDALVAYSLGGKELWRHEIASNSNIGPMRALDSGELLYSFRQDKDPTIIRRNRAGEIVWRQIVRSTGQYTFVSAIESLQDGRLAVMGSTGPWNGYVSMDRNAMLLVMDTSGDDPKMPEIVSTIN